MKPMIPEAIATVTRLKAFLDLNHSMQGKPKNTVAASEIGNTKTDITDTSSQNSSKLVFAGFLRKVKLSKHKLGINEATTTPNHRDLLC
jgi:hypothetical protein